MEPVPHPRPGRTTTGARTGRGSPPEASAASPTPSGTSGSTTGARRTSAGSAGAAGCRGSCRRSFLADDLLDDIGPEGRSSSTKDGDPGDRLSAPVLAGG